MRGLLRPAAFNLPGLARADGFKMHDPVGSERRVDGCSDHGDILVRARQLLRLCRHRDMGTGGGRGRGLLTAAAAVPESGDDTPCPVYQTDKPEDRQPVR